MAPNRKPKPRKAKVPLSQNPALAGNPALAEGLKRPDKGLPAQAEPQVGTNAEAEAPAPAEPAAKAAASPAAPTAAPAVAPATSAAEPAVAPTPSEETSVSPAMTSAPSAERAVSSAAEPVAEPASKPQPKAAAGAAVPFEDPSPSIPHPANEEPGQAEEPIEEPRRRPRRSVETEKKRLSVGKRVAIGVAAALLVMVVGVFGAFSWDRWLRYDDAADMQGEWLIEGTQTTIQIDEGQIHLTGSDAYAYQVDPASKCLTLTFGDLSGQARYRFSADRMQLSLIDGSYDALGTYFQDLPWMISSVFSSMTGKDPVSPSMGEGSITLVRPEAAAGTEEEAAPESAAVQMTEEQAAAADEALEQSGSSEVGSNAVSVEDLL